MALLTKWKDLCCSDVDRCEEGGSLATISAHMTLINNNKGLITFSFENKSMF